jgi:hypothetical protein
VLEGNRVHEIAAARDSHTRYRLAAWLSG